MNNLRTSFATAAAILMLACCSALADHKEIRGRTGLPRVLDGKNKVTIERGVIHLDTVGQQLAVTQEFWLHYAGPPAETGMDHITVALREDYFRGRDIVGSPEVTVVEARGFTSFSVYMDGHSLQAMSNPWTVNQKKDTATRWRTWEITFKPGETRRMKIITHAPLGEEVDRKFVQFVTKDVGNWRGRPDYLEIRFSAPGDTEARVAGLEPRPKDINSRAVRWVYRKASPNRDVYIQLPPEFSRRSTRG